MWRVSFVILVIGLGIAWAEENDEPEKCYGPPPLRMNPDECCQKPIFKTDFRDCLNKTRQNMIQQFRNMHENKETMEDAPNSCLANCFSSSDIFTNDGIKRDELIKVLEQQTEDSVWLPIHTTAVDKCIEVLKPDFENIQNTKWGQKCNRLVVRMLLCLNGQYFVNCPEKHFEVDNENCKEFQEHIKTCPMPRGGHWGGKGTDFGGRRGPGGRGFGADFGPPPHFGLHSGPPKHFGVPPNFGTGQVFGFL